MDLQELEISKNDIDIDEFSFKPLTKGLGFHQDRSAEVPAQVVTPSLKQDVHIPDYSNYFPKNTNEKTRSVPVYNGKVIVEKTLKTNNPVKLIEQFGSWMIDTLLISFFLLTTLGIFVLASGIEYKIILAIFTIRDVSLFLLALFSIYYLLYFTILDMPASPGKLFFGIKLARRDGKDVMASNTMVRALITLFSVPFFGLPLLTNYQGKFSGTKLVRK